MSEPFVRLGNRVKTLAEVKGRAARFASALQSMGLEHGDRYAIVMVNDIGFVEANLAASAAGAVPVPVNWHWTGVDLKHLLTDSGAKVAVVHSHLIPGVEAQRPEGMQIIEAEVPQEIREAYHLGDVPLTGRYPVLADLIEGAEPAVAAGGAPPLAVIYTSGTTGLAKGILRDPITADKAEGVTRFISEFLRMGPGLTTVLPAPLYHTAPNVNMTFGAALGMSLIIMPKFDAEEFLRLVQEHQVDTVQMVPTMFHRMLDLPEDVRGKYDLSSLKHVVHAAAPCPAETKRAMIEWLGPIISEYYGGSEGGAWTYSTSEGWLTHPGTVGKAVTGADVRILGPDLEELPVGETGVIYGRSEFWPDFTYIGNDEKRRSIEAADGFITVGDVGRLDEDGYLYLSDRLNDMVISGGVNIYPAEIESTLLSLEGVFDAAVFGIPDADMGEALAAHIQPRPGVQLTEEQVKDHVASHLAKYKVPKVVVFEEELPREDTGKLFKRRLKEKYWPAKAQA
ncbi:long-chain acyl-CoA synthetase [Nocardioides daedukensis]|uniref:Long-chain acyl-CoA synthetase n=1 Tax=Nocardioides daedukensis TaxID=634462 RepID=A0A7Y9UQY1_9ACTN|nr:AMP-binding protein [Nocardioides daedukensis]NYG59757.1 long-chain acyl-CoA synthetase [Nocardioides daedukensis]